MMSPILLHSRRNYGYDLLFTLTIILIHLTYIENAPARPAPPCGVTVPCNLGQKYGVPEDCFSYYECNRLNAMLEHKVCPGERYFDVNDLQCTYSISAVCASPCNTPEPTTVSTTPSPTTTPRATTQSTTNPSSTTPPAETPLVTEEMPVSDDTAGGKDPNAVEPPVDKLTDPPEILETIQTTVTPSPSTSSTTPSTTSTTQTPSPSTQPPSSTTSSHPGTEPGGHPPGDTETTTADSTTAVLPPPVQSAGLSVAVICIIIALVVVLVIVVAVVVIFVVVRKRKKDRRHNVAKDQPTIENPIYRKKQPLPDNNHDYRFSRDSKLVMGQQKKKPLLPLLNNNRDQNGGSGIYAIPRPQQPKAQKTYIPASIRDKRRAPPPPNPFTMKVDGNGYHTPMSDIEEDDKLNDSGQIEMTTFGDTSIPGQHTSDLFSSDSDDDDFDESFDNTVEDDGKVGSRASKSSLGDRLSKGDRASKSSPGDRASKTSSVDRLSKASSVDQGPKGNSGDRGSKTDSQNRMSGAPENKALLNEPPSLNSSFASRSSKRQAPPPPNPFGEDFESTENLDEKNPFSDTADDDLNSSDKHDTHSVDRAEEQTELLDKGERRGDSSLSEPQTDMNRSYSSFDSQQSEY